MESDNVGEERTTTPAPAVPAATRRRRRIVREVEDEGPGISRRLTVSSREEGRAIGLARGASMRRLNVWDGGLSFILSCSQLDLRFWSHEKWTDETDVPPENDEPPPPFPFPTSSSSRLPPTFTSQEQPPIPNSPPPIYELATPLSNPPPISLTEENTDRPPSRTSTRYESAPSSPVPITIGIEEEDGERNDRRMWNEDLLAGYSLEERVQREFARRGSKEVASGGPGETNEGSSSPISENGQSINAPAGPAEVSSTVVEPNTTANELAEPTSTPATTPPDGSATVPPVEEMTSKVESTTQEDVISPKVEPASISPLTASPSVPAVELESSPAPVAAEPASSLSEDKFASQAPSEPQSEVGSITDPESQSKEAPIQHNTTTSPKGPKEPTAEQVPVESTVLPTTRPIVSTFSPPRTEPAEPVTESITKPTTRPGISSTNAHHSLSTLAETPETESTIEQSTTSTSAPTRKLTRGKAIRCSSSGLIKTLSPSASPNEITAAPLFSAARFDFGKSQTVADNESGERQFIHRASAPEFSSLNDGKRENRRSEDRDRDRGFKVLGGRRLGDPPLDPIKPKEVTVNVEAIPPHREAALLRRESILAKYARPPSTAILSKPLPPDPELSPTSPKANAKRASFPSGPLIDFSDYEYDHDHDSHSNTSHHPEIPGLVAANAELLELLEQEASLPQSSSQAASKAQLVEDLRAQLQSIEEVDIENGSRERTPPPLPARQPLTHVQGAIKKKPPPPPPPIRARNWTSGQKISIAETATSPITPRPSIRRPNLNDGGSPTRKQPPPLPTRRPPPPPPQQQSALPPLFRTTSDMNSNTSSMFDGDGDGDRSSQTSTIAPLPAKIRPPVPGPWKGKFDRSPQKPRGPRPAPPPPRRSWARVVSESERPPNERTHSEEVLPLDTHQVLDNGVRSNSEMDLARPVRTRRVPEYTDLDVFVSRLQGSGREYEVSLIPSLHPFDR